MFHHSPVQPREILPFAGAALIGLASILLPGPATDWTLFALAAAGTVAIAVTGLVAARIERGRFLVLALPLAYFVVVAVLRHSGTTGGSGFVPLVMLPIVWLALFGTRGQLLVGLAAMAITLLVPFLVFGEPRYPAAAGRSTLLFLVVAALTGMAIQSLVVRMRVTRDRLSRVLRNATETAIIATDAEGTITVFNRGAERMLGYSAAEVVGKATPRLISDTDEMPGAGSRRWTYVRKDGGRVEVSLTITVEHDPSGTVTGYLGVATDITERLRAEAAVIDTAGSLVMVMDPDGRVMRFNRACEALSGRSEDEVRGSLPTRFVAPEHVETVEAAMRDATPDDFPLSFEVEWLTAGGERRLIAWSNNCLLDADGQIAYIVAAGSDVTERREALRAVMEA
jgi:PAS domain S-box-containing protein